MHQQHPHERKTKAEIPRNVLFTLVSFDYLLLIYDSRLCARAFDLRFRSLHVFMSVSEMQFIIFFSRNNVSLYKHFCMRPAGLN